METVVRVSHKQPKANGNSTNGVEGGVEGNQTGEAKSTTPNVALKSQHEVESDVDRMIDSHDNEFVLSKPKYILIFFVLRICCFRELAALTLDPFFIQDLTILYTSAAVSTCRLCLGIERLVSDSGIVL